MNLNSIIIDVPLVVNPSNYFTTLFHITSCNKCILFYLQPTDVPLFLNSECINVEALQDTHLSLYMSVLHKRT